MGRELTETDIRIGLRIRERRRQLGLTMADLAAHLGVSPPQLQKYEMGVNRVPGSRLPILASHLRLRISELVGEAALPALEPTTLAEAVAGRVLTAFFALPEDLQQTTLQLLEEIARYSDPRRHHASA